MPPRKSSSFGSATSADSSDPLMPQSAHTRNQIKSNQSNFCINTLDALLINQLCVHICVCTLRDVEADVGAGDVAGGGSGGGRELLRGEGEAQPVVHGSHARLIDD